MNNILLNNGVKIPQIGFGTWKAPTSEVTINAVKTAIENGYTHIDCASVYGNEKEVGQGIIASNISRDKLFITGKLWNDIRGYDETITKCERKAPKFIYGDISSLKNNDSISLFFIVLYF